ncbi:hypothetical protein R3P38DRAFT_3220386 [Favolaschia claudopus]|uniref:Uncharacterized protein n=1 Tax=Favolaschia claudopus TaxID=2862362 RepID=A0AAW0A2M6_9AGAR
MFRPATAWLATGWKTFFQTGYSCRLSLYVTTSGAPIDSSAPYVPSAASVSTLFTTATPVRPSSGTAGVPKAKRGRRAEFVEGSSGGKDKAQEKQLRRSQRKGSHSP